MAGIDSCPALRGGAVGFLCFLDGFITRSSGKVRKDVRERTPSVRNPQDNPDRGPQGPSRFGIIRLSSPSPPLMIGDERRRGREDNIPNLRDGPKGPPA